VQIDASGSAVFTNWMPFRRQIEQLGLVQHNNVIVNLAGTELVDHSVMEKLHELSGDFQQAGLRLDVVGLESHRQTSTHPFATRRRVTIRMKRLTIVAEAALESRLVQACRAAGASGYTAQPCHGTGRRGMAADEPLVRLESIVPDDVASRLLDAVRAECDSGHRITVCSETVDVLRPDAF
jgi:hypothetical protein